MEASYRDRMVLGYFNFIKKFNFYILGYFSTFLAPLNTDLLDDRSAAASVDIIREWKLNRMSVLVSKYYKNNIMPYTSVTGLLIRQFARLMSE